MPEKYTVDKSSLTAIADAIRDKYNSKDMIAFTDFAETIEGISGSTDDGENTKDFIITTGEFMLFDDKVVCNKTMYDAYEIEHNLSKIPLLFRLWIDTAVSITTNTINRALFQTLPCYSRNNKNYTVYNGELDRTNSDVGEYASTGAGKKYLTEPMAETEGYVVADRNKIYIGKMLSSNYEYVLRKGNVYKWIAIAKAGD